MKHLNKQLKRTGGRTFLLFLGFLLATTGMVQAQCPNPVSPTVDLQAVQIDPSMPVIGANWSVQIIVVMRNNGPCPIPTGEAQVQITFPNTYFEPGVPLNFIDNCVPARWTFLVTSTAVPGQFNMYFRNDGGPIPVGGANCPFQFTVRGRGIASPGPVPITLASTLTAAATSSDIDGSNQSASTFIIVTAGVPVILADVTATANSCNGILDWRTTSETSVEKFEVQYSTNGSNFATVGTVLAKNSPTGASYKYANDQGTSRGYYRLKIVDIDGNFNYSKIVTVDTKCSGKKSFTLYPNPLTVNQNLTIIASGYEGTVKGELISISGQVMGTYSLRNGSNVLPVDKLAQATYMLRVSDSSGDTESFRVVIMK